MSKIRKKISKHWEIKVISFVLTLSIAMDLQLEHGHMRILQNYVQYAKHSRHACSIQNTLGMQQACVGLTWIAS